MMDCCASTWPARSHTLTSVVVPVGLWMATTSSFTWSARRRVSRRGSLAVLGAGRHTVEVVPSAGGSGSARKPASSCT
jgi:hypothetical protein